MQTVGEAYSKLASRATPALIVMVLDDSGSMTDSLRGTSDAKYMWVERYTGMILKELLARSTAMKGNAVEIRPRYYLHVIQYGSQPEVWPDSHQRQQLGIDGADQELDIEQAVKLYAGQDGQAKNTLGLGGRLGGTDTVKALEKAYDFLSSAVTKSRFADSFPPMLFHLTDGMSASNAEPVAERIKQVAVPDGEVLIVNALIGVHTSLQYTGPEDFPGYLTETEAGPDPDSQRLFRMSSEMPETIRKNLIDDGIFPQLRPGVRLYFDVRTKEMLKHVIQSVGSVGSRENR